MKRDRELEIYRAGMRDGADWMKIAIGEGLCGDELEEALAEEIANASPETK